MVGVPGSLWEKCSSHIEASLRIMQAWQIGGINAKIEASARNRPRTTDQWLQGFATSEWPRLHIPKEDKPETPEAPLCSPDGVDTLLDADDITGGWESYVPGRKPAKEYVRTVLVGSLQPRLTATQPAASSDPEHVLAAPPSSSCRVDGPSHVHLPPGGRGHTGARPLLAQLQSSRPAPAAYQERSCMVSPGAPREGYIVVLQGDAPWIFADRYVT